MKNSVYMEVPKIDPHVHGRDAGTSGEAGVMIIPLTLIRVYSFILNSLYFSCYASLPLIIQLLPRKLNSLNRKIFPPRILVLYSSAITKYLTLLGGGFNTITSTEQSFGALHLHCLTATVKMPASTLKGLAIKACIKNISSLTDVGDLEFSQCHQVLRRIDSPAQLHLIEENSPQIASDTEDLWRHFISRDIPNWEAKNYAPKDPSGWYLVYAKYKRQQEREIEKSREELRQSLAGIKSKRDAMTSKVVDLRSLPKMPRDPRLIANGGNLLKRKSTGWKKEANNSSLTWASGSKTKMTNGKSVLTRARREAKEISAMSRLSRPMTTKIGQVSKAPTGLVDEYRRAGRPIESTVKILARKRTAFAADRMEQKEKEARLRALTMQKKYVPAVGQTVIGSSDEDSGDELFDEPPPKQQSRSAAPVSSRPMPSKERYSGPDPVFRRATETNLKQRPLSRPAVSSPALSRPSAPTQHSSQRSPSPTPKPVMKRRAPVDVFNRTVKKPRSA